MDDSFIYIALIVPALLLALRLLPGRRRSRYISASEIASFAYSPEQWHREYVLGLPASNQAALDAGTRHHGRKAAAERVAGGAIACGRLLAVIGLGGLLWLVWRSL